MQQQNQVDMRYLNYNDFIAAVSTRADYARQEHDWRYGQAFFNVLLEETPEIANELRATKLDPFHKNAIEAETYQRIRELYETKEIK